MKGQSFSTNGAGTIRSPYANKQTSINTSNHLFIKLTTKDGSWT